MSSTIDYDMPTSTLGVLYDPREEILNYTTILGPDQITFGDIDDYVNSQLKNAFIFSARIGAGGMAMIALWLFARSKKTPIFILNQIVLLLMILHSGLYIRYLLDTQASVTYEFTGFESLVTDYSLNIYAAANVFQLLLTMAIEISIAFQVHTMFNGLQNRVAGLVTTSLASFVALSVIGLDFYNVAMANKVRFDDRNDYFDSRSVNAETILFACSINFMSALLIIKLILAIRSRRYLGLKQFDTFHILLIMSLQSMIIPSILTILSYALIDFKYVPLPAVSVLLVALSLPLSSMWAASVNTSDAPTSSRYNAYSSSSTKTPYSATLGSASSRYKADFDDYDKELNTPTTAAGEKNDWLYGDSSSVEGDEFVSRTTHQLNTSNMNVEAGSSCAQLSK